MQRIGPWLLLCTVLTLPAPPSVLRAQDSGSGTGSIQGRVANADGRALPGASVRLDGTSLSTRTGVDGRFRLGGVPTGPHTLNVEFLGFEAVQASVDVRSGRVTTLDVILDQPTFTEAVTVRATPILQGQAKALNQQKTAINIQNIVSADQFGRFPDPNAAEATQRIPGITLQRDQGEGRYVIVRGTEARLNSMTINGERIPSPEGDVRQVALDVIPADLLEAIEVSKALTPDMDADAIGGAVNLVTRRAPAERRVSLTGAFGHNELDEGDILVGNAVWGQRFSGDRVGILLAASTMETDRGSENFEVEYDDGELAELQLRDYLLTRERDGVNLDLDFRASSVLAGARWESTDADYRANEVLFDEEGDFAGIRRLTGDDSYDVILPSAHLRYALDGNSNLRIAVTRGLARPDFESLAPFELVNEEDGEIERGNPELDVTTAWNLDLMYERYFRSVGIFSAGVFYKQLRDPIYFFTFEEMRSGEKFDVVQPGNGDDADLLGFELAYQNQIRSGPLEGLGFYANYTYTDSEATFPERADTRFPSQAESVYNLASSYALGLDPDC
ncbi:MAG: TonB-dependent receptor [Holophagales bacterium]|nr:TonB-dependent receptor [Holophagales bacterium]